MGLKETEDGLATANGVGWCGHVLRRYDNSVLKVALDFEVSGKRARTTKDLEEASERGGWKTWFKEGGCLESSKVG